MSQNQKTLLEGKSKELHQYLHEIFETVPFQRASDLSKYTPNNDTSLIICLVDTKYIFIYKSRMFELHRRVNNATNVKTYTLFSYNLYRGPASLGISRTTTPIKFIRVTLPNIRFYNPDPDDFGTPFKQIKQFDFNDRLFNILFQKSEKYNEYYDCFGTNVDEMSSIPFPETFNFYKDLDGQIFSFMENYRDVYGNLTRELFIRLVFCKYFKKVSTNRVNCENPVIFKTTDKKLSAEMQKGKFVIEKYVPQQGGKVYLINKKTDQKIITKIKFLKNVFRKNQKKNNTKQASFAYEIS